MELGKEKEVIISKTNLDELTKAIDSCKGAVYLVTDEGDRLNLKSQLCRMVGLFHIIEGGKFSGGRLECDNAEDCSLLFRFNLYGNSKK